MKNVLKSVFIVVIVFAIGLLFSIATAAPNNDAPGQNRNKGGSSDKGNNSMVVSLTDYRFRNDDGSEVTATWKEALNTPVTLAPGEKTRIRVRVAETAGVSPKKKDDPVRDLYWQYRITRANGTSSDLFDYQITTLQCDAQGYLDSLVDGDDTTEQFASTTSNYITDNNALFDANGSATSVEETFGANTDVELELCFQVPSDLNTGDIIELKTDYIFGGQIPLDSIDNMPTIFVQ